MGITVVRGVSARIRENPGAILLQVSQASDREAATEAMRRARADIVDLNGGAGSAPGLGPADRNSPKYVGEVVPARPGPCLFVDGGHTPARLLATIPKIVARHLEAAGVTDAVVSVPPLGGPLLDALTRRPEPGLEVYLTLYPPPPPNFRRISKLPDAWLDLAQAWVCEGLGPDDELFAKLAPGIEFPVPVSHAADFLRQGRATRNALCVLVSGHPHERVRAVTLRCSSQEQTAALSAAGNRDATDELLVEYSRLRDLGRSVAADVAYAHLTLEPHVGAFAVNSIMGEWSSLHGGAQPFEVGMFCDRIVKDAFPFQILGPGHLERLGEAPPGAVALAGDRVELSFGDPTDWLPDDPPPGWEDPTRWAISRWRRDKTIQTQARRALRPCLIRSWESSQLFPIAEE